QAEDGIRDFHVTGVQTCALPIYRDRGARAARGPGDAALLSLVPLRRGPGRASGARAAAHARAPRAVPDRDVRLRLHRTLEARSRSEERRVGKEGTSRGATGTVQI